VKGLALAVAWFAAISLALVAWAAIERRQRVARTAERPELAPPRALWGGGVVHPPSRSMLARALAAGARLVRSRTRVRDRAHGLRAAARAVACVALASALALVPFSGTFGGRAGGTPLVVVDLQPGLAALVFFLLLAALASVAVGLVEDSAFARLACVRLAGRVLALAGTLAVVLAPLALATGSLRLHAIVLAQEGLFSPLAVVSAWLADGAALARSSGLADVSADALAAGSGGSLRAALERAVWPAWHVFRQPLTALLFVPVVGLLVRRPLALDPIGGGVRLSAFGHDDDPHELYWARIEERLAMVLFAALFVALFLGAGAIPFVSTSALVAPLAPFFGEGLPAILAAGVALGVFLLKLALVLALVARMTRRMATLRDDQWIRLVTRRLLPLAWANLLLVAGATLLVDVARKGGA